MRNLRFLQIFLCSYTQSTTLLSLNCFIASLSIIIVILTISHRQFYDEDADVETMINLTITPTNTNRRNYEHNESFSYDQSPNLHKFLPISQGILNFLPRQNSSDIYRLRNIALTDSADEILSKININEEFKNPTIILGILSLDTNINLRNYQRKTFLLDGYFAYKFLIDRPTNETILENENYGDLIFLNTTYLGHINRYGEKLYLWYKYLLENENDDYKSIETIIKMDDDAFICSKHMFQTLKLIQDPWLYYGWIHGKAIPSTSRKIGSYQKSRMDEMFVAIGKDLAKSIISKQYCHDKWQKCDKTKSLPDENHGGTSLSMWIQQIQKEGRPIKTVYDNDRIVHRVQKQKHGIDIFRFKNFCKSFVIYHKCSGKKMSFLHEHTDNIWI